MDDQGRVRPNRDPQPREGAPTSRGRRRLLFAVVGPARSSATSMTSSRRGPCTPSTRCSSMSLVALGPLIQVSGDRGSRRVRASGTPATTCSARTTTTWWSGIRDSARLPCPAPPSSTIVPVSAIATAHSVKTLPMRSSSAAGSGRSSHLTFTSSTHDAGTPAGTTTLPAASWATASRTCAASTRWTTAAKSTRRPTNRSSEGVDVSAVR